MRPDKRERYDRGAMPELEELDDAAAVDRGLASKMRSATEGAREKSELQRLAEEVQSFRIDPELLQGAQAQDRKETGLGRASDSLYSAFSRRPMQQRGEVTRNVQAVRQREAAGDRAQARFKGAEADARKRALEDPNSEESQRLREFFAGTPVGKDISAQIGDLYGRVPGSQIPGADELFDMMEKRSGAAAAAKAAREAEDRKRGYEVEDRNYNAASRERVATLQGQRRDDAREDKARAGEEKRGRESFLEGYQLRPDVSVRPEDMSKLRNAQAATNTINRSIDAIEKIVRETGGEVLPTSRKAELELLLADLQLNLKSPEAYALGVLAGPDMAILDAVTGKPIGPRATIFEALGGEQNLTKLRRLRGLTEGRFSDKVRAFGFDRAGGDARSAGGSEIQTGADGRKYRWNGSAFELVE